LSHSLAAFVRKVNVVNLGKVTDSNPKGGKGKLDSCSDGAAAISSRKDSMVFEFLRSEFQKELKQQPASVKILRRLKFDASMFRGKQ
jgi:hypothetical protein